MTDPSTCKDCFFAVARPARQSAHAGHLHCHRSPPVSDAQGWGRWPVVSPEEWCGEHQWRLVPKTE